MAFTDKSLQVSVGALTSNGGFKYINEGNFSKIGFVKIKKHIRANCLPNYNKLYWFSPKYILKCVYKYISEYVWWNLRYLHYFA